VNVIGFFIQPQTEERCRLYTTLWRNDLEDDPAAAASSIAFEQEVLNEDLAVQSRYDLLSLPLDLRTEVHTRADRNTMELRRVLAELVAATEAPGEAAMERGTLSADDVR
jgi:vanillate O-demethylase monooxygenase subunit